MYEQEPLPRVSEVKTVSRPASQQSAVAVGPSGVGSTSTASQANEPQAGAAAVDPRTLQQTVGQMNSFAQTLNRSLQFRVDDESGEVVVRVVDSQTDEVIRQIPSEEVLTIAKRMRTATEQTGDPGMPGLLIHDSV